MSNQLHDNQSYKFVRYDLIKFVESNAEHVLDVGCNDGANARYIYKKCQNSKVYGIEIIPEALEKAMPVLHKGWLFDLDDLKLLTDNLLGHLFDTIIAGDVLEHTNNPNQITKILYDHLTPGGKIIISVPNYNHWHLLFVFLKQKWERNERGIFDKTHKTIFMKGNLGELASLCPSSKFKLVHRNYRFFETNRIGKINKVIRYGLFPLFIIPYLREFFTHSYVILITKPK